MLLLWHKKLVDAASFKFRLQNASLDGSSLLYQEHETGKKGERRAGVVKYTSPPLALPQVQENPEDYLVYQRFLEGLMSFVRDSIWTFCYLNFAKQVIRKLLYSFSSANAVLVKFHFVK